ncbi:MAG: hypothetical protein PHW80_00345 [Smithellaceae bacterium]|mgnify:CR=1 FL=1|jgi:peptidoglycan hydrolase CwlO-like protein|nr:hypothetical protein [Smithellaceae bacterium]MDD3259067.1 hypothetical protein [Smithellaceae bacterium]MDD3847735.1 hypothetical protein [Smithellaceae bacterium]HOG12062.1 hypothetical protein [Smithellaceae bacterium]HOQ71459.1 hypothetical protein [Smithellaceae bacterium]
MASKSREVRMEQRRILEKKLELRLQKLEALGAAKEKDPMVKNLRSQIRETDIRIAAFDKNIAKIEILKQAKARKLAEKDAPREAPAAPEKEGKAKKKAAPAEKESKKKAAPAEGEAPKKPKKKKEDAPAE